LVFDDDTVDAIYYPELGFLQALHVPLPIKLTAMIILKYCWKWH